METEEPVYRSPLEKPLEFLTEDDISQLTREDCRRFLKDKGMRRPSWNKSQAIQQVISLKRLLETTPGSDSGVKKKPYSTSRFHNPPTTTYANKSTSGEAPVSEPAVEGLVPNRQKDVEKCDLGSDSVLPRNESTSNGPGRQLTIFYCGKVNVYDDVPAEKAHTIMQLAASPHQLPKEVSLQENNAMRFTGDQLHFTKMKEVQESPTMMLPSAQAGVAGDTNDSIRLHREDSGTFREENSGADGSYSRKASVQRYLEKRKDRFKSKAKLTSPSASLDIYANHLVGNQTADELPNRNSTCSSPQIRPPNTPSRCSHFSEE